MKSSTSLMPLSGWLQKAARAAFLSAVSAFVLYTAAKAMISAVANDDFPESLAVKVELLPLIFPVHMVTGALALLLGPLAWALRRRPTWHRLVGRVAAADVLVSGVTAYPVAWAAPVTMGSTWGFTAQASLWLTLLALGVRYARERRLAAHRACMLLMLATTSGAVVFRVLLAVWTLVGPRRSFDTFYACDAWIGWIVPFAATALFLLRSGRKRGVIASGNSALPA